MYKGKNIDTDEKVDWAEVWMDGRVAVYSSRKHDTLGKNQMYSFILKDLFLIPGILGHYSDRVSSLLSLSGILAACILPQE